MIAFAAAQTAHAAAPSIYWKADKVGGSEESPYLLSEPDNWQSGGPAAYGKHIFFNITGARTYISSSGVENSTCDNFTPEAGDFVFLGKMTFKCLNGGAANQTVSILKKGDWTVSTKYHFYAANGNNSKFILTNETGKVEITNSSTLYLANGSGSEAEIVSTSGDWTASGQTQIAAGANSTASFILKGGSLTCPDYLIVGKGASANGSLIVEGGEVKQTGKHIQVGAGASSTGIVTVKTGGKITSSSAAYAYGNCMAVGSAGSGTLNVQGGEVYLGSASGALGMCASSSGSLDSTVNVTDGGSVTTYQIKHGDGTGLATLTIDGGTIKAFSDNTSFIPAHDKLYVYVGDGGATFDTNGKSITIAEDLQNKSGEVGVVTFAGGGTVTLNGAVSYTGGTTVEAGTVVVVPNVATRTALGAITVTGLANSVCEVVRLSGEGMFGDADLPADVGGTTFRVSADGKSILAASGIEGSFWIGGSGDLGTPSNWSDGVVPTDNPTIKWSSPITLTNSGAFSPSTLTIPDDSAVVTLAGALTLNSLTNAYKLAVASTGSLTITGDLVLSKASGTALYSNEGTVIVNGDVDFQCVAANTTYYQYEVVTDATTPIRTGGLAYNGTPPDTWHYLTVYLGKNTDSTRAGQWVIGSNGLHYKSKRQIYHTGFKMAQGVTTLYSSSDWSLANSGMKNSVQGDLYVPGDSRSSLVIDTSDYDTPATRRTVTLNGRIVAYNPVTIKGCGTVVVDTSGSYTGLPEDFQHTCITNATTLYVTDTATLKINASKKITGNGIISLAAGTTLALDSSAIGAIGDTEFTPCIPGLALPETGTATLQIDGSRLHSGDYVILNSVPAGYAGHLTVTGTAIDGRRTALKNDGANLILTIVPSGLVISFR